MNKKMNKITHHLPQADQCQPVWEKFTLEANPTSTHRFFVLYLNFFIVEHDALHGREYPFC